MTSQEGRSRPTRDRNGKRALERRHRLSESGTLGNATATHTRDELQASSPYLPVLAQHLERLDEVDETLVLREVVDGTKRVVVPTSISWTGD